MSYLDHIRACNAHDPDRFRVWRVAGQPVGAVRHAFAAMLTRRFPEIFVMDGGGLSLAADLTTVEARSAAVERALKTLAEEGTLGGWRDERYPVARRFFDPPLLLIERAGVPWFGVRAYGVHMNGFVRKEDGLWLWIGRRALDKPVAPGKLDNLVAGGQPHGLGLRENLIKEAREEAAIPEDLMARAVPVGVISYCLEVPEGLKPDTLFLFDLELPADFVPRNTDGELAGFQFLPAETVAEIVRTTDQFKFNCNLVIIDFLIRHGLIGPEDPDYLELAQGLRR